MKQENIGRLETKHRLRLQELFIVNNGQTRYGISLDQI